MMTRYPDYKESEFQWIGQIPAHWDTKPVWMMFHLGRGRVISNEEIADNSGQYPVYSSQTENAGIMGYIDTYDFDGDYVTWTTDGAKAGTVFYRTGKFNCTNVCGTLSPSSQNVDLRFFGHALNIVTSRFVRQDINPKLMNNVMAKIRVQVPPLTEQTQIANFLDHKTAQIDKLIRAKERKIELLDEYRASLIQQAVTKGLDPNVEMKPSGLEWIREIPNSWQIKPLKYIAQGGLTNGLFKKKNQFGSGTKLINVADIYQDDFYVKYETLNSVETEPHEVETYAVEPGDIFFVRSSLKLEGIAASVCIGEVPEPTVFECHLVRVHPCPTQVSPRYLINYLNSNSIRQRLVTLANTVTMTTIAQPKLASIEIILPPLAEQRIIADFLDRKTRQIDELRSNEEQNIKLLKEYRQSLISEVVTGKIDVRDEV